MQSAATTHPEWVDTCMESVRRWAAGHGADYDMVEDSAFLALAPVWLREASSEWIHPITDFARLELAHELLCSYETVVWIDSDVLVLDQAGFPMPHPIDAAFAREVWLERPNEGPPVNRMKVSNYVCAFGRGGTFLPYYRTLALTMASQTPGPYSQCLIGTDFLTAQPHHRFSLVRHAANLSPLATSAFLTGDLELAALYDEGIGHEVRAANLCLSHVEIGDSGVRQKQDDVARLVAYLMERGSGGRFSDLVRDFVRKS